jgi:hypothetical protein
MTEKPNPLDYESRPARPPTSTGAEGLRARLARVSDNRWMVIVLLVAASIQSVLYPVEIFHSHEVAIWSARLCLVVLKRDTDIFGAILWIPYAVLALIVLWRPLRRR